MRRQSKKEVPTGPALMGEQVSEFWVWLWSRLDRLERNGRQAELDEARRLAVALDRAVEHQAGFDYPSARFTRDQSPVSTALLVHYVLTRIERQANDTEEARGRLELLNAAAALLGQLLHLDFSKLTEHFERLGVGIGKRSVFRPEVREGITIESLDEGPTLPAERKVRDEQARLAFDARWKAMRDRPRARRQLGEVTR